MGGLSKGIRQREWVDPFQGVLAPTKGVERGCPCGCGSGPSWGMSEGPHRRARLLPLLAGLQACAGEEPCERGVWSAGLGIINRARRWGWEWACRDLEPPESVPGCLVSPLPPGPWNVLA